MKNKKKKTRLKTRIYKVYKKLCILKGIWNVKYEVKFKGHNKDNYDVTRAKWETDGENG